MTNPVLLSSFTPSNMRPETLEAIFVKRDPLAGRILDSLVGSIVDGDIEHHLAVGPRGMGKSHLLTIVVNRLREHGLGDALAVAWLREEEWGVTSVGELYEQMLLQLADDPTAEGSLRSAAATAAHDLFSVDPEVLADAAEGHLTELLAGRRLMVVVENLDQIFSSIGEDDQHQLRAYLQTQRNIVLLASSPSLSPSIATREGLFFGFFAIHHLDELTIDEARDLLLRIAGLRKDDEGRRLQAYLRTDEATNRLKVVARITGGHPRLWVLMSECITTERLDEIVSLLHALLDDLTPYYQAQMASLSGQQRKVVTVLAKTDGALLVKDIASHARLAHNAAAKHIGDLVKLGFVKPAVLADGVEMTDRRTKAYELREPLLRHCLEMKESRTRPLGLIVGVLRAWYTPTRLRELSEMLSGPATAYLEAALAVSGGGIRSRPVVEELLAGRAAEAFALAEEARLADPDDPEIWVDLGIAALATGRFEVALSAWEVVEEHMTTDTIAIARQGKAGALLGLGREDDAIALLGVDEGSPNGLLVLARARLTAGDVQSALDDLERAASINPKNPEVQEARHDILLLLGRYDDAIDAQMAIVGVVDDPRKDVRAAIVTSVREGRLPTVTELAAGFGDELKSGGDAATTEFIAALLRTATRRTAHDFAAVAEALVTACPPQLRMLVIGSIISAGFLDDAPGATPASRHLWQDALARTADDEEMAMVGEWITWIESFLTTGDAAWLLRLPEPAREVFTPANLAGEPSPDDS